MHARLDFLGLRCDVKLKWDLWDMVIWVIWSSRISGEVDRESTERGQSVDVESYL
jgi:hypothetical protein